MSSAGEPPSGPPPGAPPMGPPLKFQPGERENYNRGPEIIGVSCTLGALAFAVLCLRIWVRIRFIRQLAVEDYLMAVSAVRPSLPPLVRRAQEEHRRLPCLRT